MELQQNQKHWQILQQTHNSKINVHRSNNRSTHHQLQSIPFYACFHKSEYRRTQAIQHLDRYFTRILPTFWCSKCDSWSSHHDKIHDERIRWQNMKNAQMTKQEGYRTQTQQSHYGPPQLQDRSYGQNNNNKRSDTAYSRDNYQDKRSRNDRGRSPSRDRSNSHTRSPGDNNQNGATFYDDKNKYQITNSNKTLHASPPKFIKYMPCNSAKAPQ
jgi:hypothetical protein